MKNEIQEEKMGAGFGPRTETGGTPTAGSITNTMLATDVKIGSLGDLDTTADSSVVAAINELVAGGGSFTGTLTSPVTKEAPVLGGEKYADPGLESWISASELTDYDDGDFGDNCDGTLARESTEVPEGSTYSAKLTTDSTTQSPHYFVQGITTTGDTFKFSFWAKDGTGQPQIVLIDTDPANGGPGITMYNWTGASAGTWTEGGEQGPTSDQVKEYSCAAWTENVEDNIPTSPTGTVYVLYVSPAGATEYCYYDDLSFKCYDPVPATLFEYTSTVDSADLGASDSVFVYETTGGTDVVYFEQDGAGAFKTDFTTFDFTDKPMAVAEATAVDHALNKINAYSTLASVPNINLKATGFTTLYTVPAGYTCYYEIESDFTVNNYTLGFAGSIGTNIADPQNPGANDYTNYNTWAAVGSVFSSGVLRWGAGGGLNSFTGTGKALAGTTIKLNVTTAATATTLGGTIKVRGYLIAD